MDFKDLVESIVDECVGKIVKDVNTSIDVGEDQIKKEADKFNLNVDKNGNPESTFSKYIFHLKESTSIPNKFKLSDDLDYIVQKLNLNDNIINNNQIIYFNNKKELHLTTDKFNGEFLTYSRFCSDNPNLSSNVKILDIRDNDILDLKTKEYISMNCYTEDRYVDYTNEEVKSQIIDYFNWFKDNNGSEEPKVLPKVKTLITSLKFNSSSIENMNLDSSKIKNKIDGGVIFVNCFEKISGKKPSINSYKQAMTDHQYPKELMRFLEENNFTKEGEGVYGAVYSSAEHNIVIKIDKGSIDKPYLKFARFCKEHRTPHLPKMGKIRVFDNYYVLPMERLTPGKGKDFALMCAWCDMYANASTEEESDLAYNAEFPKQWMDQKHDIANLIHELEQIIDINDEYFDIHEGNIMMRGNTIVFTDPMAAV